MLPFPPATSLKWLLRLVIGVAIITILIAWKGAGVQAALAQASWRSLAISVALYLATQLISAWKWQILLNASLPDLLPDSQAQSAARSTPDAAGFPKNAEFSRPTLSACFRFYLMGMFCNLWLPTSVGGDAVRAALAGKRWGNLPIAVSSILVERITGLLALLVIGASGWLFWWTQTASHYNAPTNAGNASNSVLYPALGALAATGVLGLLLIALRKSAYHLEARSSSSLIGKWAKIHRAMDVFTSPPLRPALAQALVLSLVFQSTQVALNVYLAHSIGLNLSPIIFIWLVPSLAIASLIPLGIGGLGVREGAAVSLIQSALPIQHAPEAATILAWSLLWQATLWLSGLPGAIAYLTQKERTP